MDNKGILSQKKEILEKLSKRQLKNAFELLNKLVVHVQGGRLSEKLNELETTYRYMLHYQFDVENDPTREDMYASVLRTLYEITDDVSDELQLIESTNIFYERIRINTIRTPLTFAELRKQLKEMSETISLADLLENGENKNLQMRDLAVKRERLDSELFNTIFVSPRAGESLEKEYKDFLNDAGIPVREKCLFVSALTMNLFHRFDSRKLSVIMAACRHAQAEISQRATVGLVVVLQMYDIRWMLYPECQFELDSLSENKLFRTSVLTVVKQLIRSRETEAISRKLTEEIIPEMLKFNSLVGKKINLQDLLSETDFADKNPDWKKELEESGLAGKLQEYSELQMDGADVFHSTFSGLKNFPFFREIGNWFMPFDITYSELQPLNYEKNGMSDFMQAAVLESATMCNSDKYSFAFSILHISSGQRQMMINHLGEEANQIKELQKETGALNPAINEEKISNQYIQDLYRFFKVYPYRNNFFDIFRLRLNFYDKKSIAPLISEPATMSKIANYCFDKNFFAEALPIYQKLIGLGQDSSDTWQRLGYCKQMLNDLQGALDAYLQAEMLSPQNSWIVKRIAQVYRTLKNPQLSMEYYQRAAQLNPDNLNIELNIGHCYLELGDYEKALNYYFKIEVMETNTNKAWRPVAWTAFLLRKFDVAQNYYRKILSDKPNVHDLLNAGHVELCLDKKKAALDLYVRAAQKSENTEQFIKLFDEDKKELISAGADESFFPFILDEIMYKLDK